MSQHPTEALLQTACYRWWKTHFRRQSLLYSVPNGGTRDVREAQSLNDQGLTAGVYDLTLMLPAGRTVYIEMKNGKQPLRDNQTRFKQLATYLGHETREAYSFDDFKRIICEVLAADITQHP